MKIFSLVFLLSILIAGFAGSTPDRAEAETWSVSLDGTGDFTSIQEAVGMAASGDVIEIQDSGTYFESITIDSKTLTVRALPWESPIIDAGAKGDRCRANCFFVQGSPGTVIEGIECRNAGGFGIKYEESADVTTRRCVFQQNGAGVGHTSCIGAVVEDCLFYENHSSGEAAIHFWSTPNALARRNLIYENNFRGIAFGNYSYGGTADHNTVVESVVGQVIVGLCSTGCTVTNNILKHTQNNADCIRVESDSVSGFTSDFNLLYRTSARLGSWGGHGACYTLPEWQDASGQDLHSLSVIPGFADEYASDFRLGKDSPCVAAGMGGTSIGRWGAVEIVDLGSFYYGTIQEAVNASVSGNVVEIADSGTYAEQVEIWERSITLRPAAGHAPTVDGEGLRNSCVRTNYTESAVIDGIRCTGSLKQGIELYESLGVIVRGCILEENGAGIIVNRSDACTIEKCRVRDNSDYATAGICFWYAATGLARNNLVYGSNFRGIHFVEAPGGQAYNNTVLGSVVQLEAELSSTDCRFQNNILKALQANNYCIKVDPSSQAGLVSDTNDLCSVDDAFTGYWGGHKALTLADWQSASSRDGSSLDADPLFLGEADGVLSLEAASPCIDAGAPIGEVTDDFDGRARPLGAAFDMGAYEHVPGGTCFLGAALLMP